jgi:predicted short-subunit dehydrogenase-like oxidoreductase (DUF2520 family)
MKTEKPLRLLIGSGRAHTHFSHYLYLLQTPYLSWNRYQAKAELQSLLARADQVWVLISDSQIQSFIEKNLREYKGSIVHCSGALQIPGTVDIHPLMTFGAEPYNLKRYENLHFVSSSLAAKSLLAGLPNAVHSITEDQKALYHALCVSAGNFTTLLWQEAGEGFAKMGLPSEAWHPYLIQITENLLRTFENALTGPIARKDYGTIEKNLKSLEGTKLKEIYQSFAQAYLPK